MQEETRVHLGYLDGWRGVAITLVLLGHFWLDAIRPGASRFGVGVFFVLSGRLMAEILFVRRSELPTFFRRRFSRVYPGLLAFVLLITLAVHGTRYAHGIVAVLVTLTFTSNYAMTYTHPIAMLDHIWSLCVEEQGYLILAVVALLTRRAVPHAAVAIGLLGLAALIDGIVRVHVWHQPFDAVAWRTDVQVAPLFLAAAMYLAMKRCRAVPPAWIAPAAFLLAFAAELWGPPWSSPWCVPVLLAISAVTVDHAPDGLRRLLQNAVLRRIGLWSYSVYLWQQPFYKLHRDHPEWTFPLLAAGIACGLASFYLVERPARRFLNGRAATRPTLAAA